MFENYDASILCAAYIDVIADIIGLRWLFDIMKHDALRRSLINEPKADIAILEMATYSHASLMSRDKRLLRYRLMHGREEAFVHTGGSTDRALFLLSNFKDKVNSALKLI